MSKVPVTIPYDTVECPIVADVLKSRVVWVWMDHEDTDIMSPGYLSTWNVYVILSVPAQSSSLRLFQSAVATSIPRLPAILQIATLTSHNSLIEVILVLLLVIIARVDPLVKSSDHGRLGVVNLDSLVLGAVMA